MIPNVHIKLPSPCALPWPGYLEMRERIIKTNGELQSLLPDDLGAIAGLLYEVGSGKITINR